MFWLLLLFVVLLYVLDRLNKNAGGDGIPVVGPLFDQALEVVGSVFNGNRRLTIDFSFREINDRYRRSRAARRAKHRQRTPSGKTWRQRQNKVAESDAVHVEPTLDTPLAEEPTPEHIEKTTPEIREVNDTDTPTDQQEVNGTGKPRSHRHHHHHHHRHGHSERGAEGHRHNNKPHSERNKRHRRAKSERIDNQQH